MPFATKPLSEKLKGHDLAIVVGAPVFRYYPYVAGSYIPDGMRLLHITDDPIEAGRAPVGDSLLSDAVLALEGLHQLVMPRKMAKTVVKQPHGMAPHSTAETQNTSEILSASQLFRALREVSPEDTVLVEESPSNLGELHQEYDNVTRLFLYICEWFVRLEFTRECWYCTSRERQWAASSCDGNYW